jgi:hypothetical protein
MKPIVLNKNHMSTSIGEKISLSIQILTLIAATYIGVVQTQINVRQASLEDFVAIAVSPDNTGEKLTLLNTGSSNLYISKIEFNDQKIEYDRSRLLPTGTLESSYYWVNPPTDLPLDQDFDLKIYVTDQFGDPWISQHGGRVYEYTLDVQGTPVIKRALNTWSYRTEQLKK